MKKEYLKWIIFCAIICIAVFALMGAAENPEAKTIKDLLEQRNVVMENVLLGKITYDEGKIQLQQIEDETIYKRDLAYLAQYCNTDVDIIEDMEIIKMEKKSDVYDIMTFEGEIRWTCRSTEEIYHETNIYRIGVADNGSNKSNKYRLISFEIVKN